MASKSPEILTNLTDFAEIDLAMRRAVQAAVLRHKQLGNAVVRCAANELEWIPAEEIAPAEK